MSESAPAADDHPNGNNESLPETGNAGNRTEEQEIQFRCKLCHYTGKDKEEIANHFLGEHIAVEVRSIGRDESNSGTDGGFVEVSTPKKANSRKRGRPRKGARQKVEEEEEDDDDEDDETGKAFVHKPSQVSISRSGRRRKIPFKFAVDADDDGSHPYLSSSRSSRRGKGTRKGRMNKNWRLLGEDETFYKRHSLTVTPGEFEYQLLKLVEDWEQTWFLQKSTEDVRCKHPSCKCQLDEEEMSLHLKCHKPFLEGFQCPMCEFVCVHWRNMRHHYYKDHQQKGKTLSCNLPSCDAVFERFGELKRHVSTTHLKTKLVAQLSKPSTQIHPAGSNEEQQTVKTEPNDEVSENEKGAETEEPSNGNADSTGSNEVQGKDDEMDTGESEENNRSAEKVADYVEVEMDGEGGYQDQERCEIEMTKKRITKKRKSTTLESDDAFEDSGEGKKKRHYVKSGEFDDNMVDRQRALVAYACDLCGAKYNDLDDLEKHRGHHEELDDEDGSTIVMKCTECNLRVATSELLVEHIKQKHKRLLKLHRCHLCQFSSERRFDLKKHLVIHTGVKNYMCDQCGKCMSTPYNLKIHYLRLHATEEEKNITCSEEDCDFKCADKAVLKDHLRQKHNLMIDNKDSDKVEKIKLFSCKHCDYTGKKESSLRYHMRIHLENRQHKCKLCPYASKTKNNLILHMRTHDGMQPVKCSQCDFRGATNKIISEHILSKHAGIRPYRCLVCKWSTSYSGNMWKHIHDHRNELGDAMPNEPVEVITGEGVAIPVPLRPPSGKKRTKNVSPQYSRSTASDNIKAISKELEAARSSRVDAQLIQLNTSGANPEETVTIVEVPMGDGESSMIMGGSENATTSALNSLAAAVATAREVALLSQQAQAVISGQQGTDSNNPYPVSQLFQQIAGQASGQQQTQIFTSALASSCHGNEVIIAVTSPDSLQEAVLQSGITSSSQSDNIGVAADQTKVTYTIAPPRGGEEEVQFTVQPDIHFENQAAVADIPDPEEPHVESDHVYVSINESDLQVSEDERHGQTLQIVESTNNVKDHVSGEQTVEVEDHSVPQLVTMMPEGELVMSMVPTASQGNPTYVANGQQPVEAHIVVSDPDNPGQYIQQEIHYVQTNENGEAILEQNGTTQVVHIVQQENGELAYQDSDGQVYTAENTHVMFQSTDQSDGDFIPNEIPEAITISDADGRLGIPDSEQLGGSEGQSLGVDQHEVQIAVPAEFIDQSQQDEGELVAGDEQSHSCEEEVITPEDLTTTQRVAESHETEVMSNAPEENQDDVELKDSVMEQTEDFEDKLEKSQTILQE